MRNISLTLLSDIRTEKSSPSRPASAAIAVRFEAYISVRNPNNSDYTDI